MNKNILIGLVALGGLLLISSSLLNRGAEPAATTERGEQTETEDGKEEAQSVRDLGVPIFAGEIVNELVQDNGGVQSASFAVRADASVDEINEWYRAELSQNGWTIEKDQNIGGYQIITARNQEKYTNFQAVADSETGLTKISQQIKIEAEREE